MKYLLIILLCLIGYVGVAQKPTGVPGQFNTGWQKWGWQQGDSGTILANRDTGIYAPRFPFTIQGRLLSGDTSVFYWTGQRWRQFGTSNGTLTGAINGLSLSGTNVQLGGTFTKSDTLDYNGDSLHLLNGYTRVKAAVTTQPVFRIENTSPGASEQLYIVGDMAAIRLFANGASPFAAITQYTNNTLRNSYGYDGPANHVFLCDLRNSVLSATFEEGGNTYGGFYGGTHNFWMGQGASPDTAALNLYRTGTALTTSSQQMVLYGSNWGTTYNTSGGAITNRLGFMKNGAQRSSGGSNLTNITLALRAFGGQVNQALVIDTGDVVFGAVFNSGAFTNNSHLQDISNAASTQKRSELHAERAVRYADTVGGTETFSAGIYGRNDFFIKASATIPNELSGTGIEGGLFLRKNSAYSGTSTFTGSTLPNNGLTTMPSAMLARLDISGSATGGNNLLATGWWAVMTAAIYTAANNRMNKVAFINSGAIQTGGTIDTAFGLYINPIANYATAPYAIYAAGSADTVRNDGVTRLSNLSAQTDTTTYKPMAVSANGVIVKLDRWAGSGGSSGITTLNTLTATTQTFATGTAGTDFAISSATSIHTFNLPTASATNRGALSSANWTTFNGKIGPSDTASMLLPYFRQNGNSFGTTATLGTTDAFPLNFIANGTARMQVAVNGEIYLGGLTDQGTYAIQLNARTQVFGQSSTGSLIIGPDGVNDNLATTILGIGSNAFRGTIILTPSGANTLSIRDFSSTTDLFTIGVDANAEFTHLLTDAATTGVKWAYAAHNTVTFTSGDAKRYSFEDSSVLNHSVSTGTYGSFYAHPSVTASQSTDFAFRNDVLNNFFNNTSGNSNFGGTLSYATTVSSAGTLTLGSSIVYVFSGSSATWTLPAVSGTTGRMYILKNRGSSNITLNSNSGSEIYDTAAQTSTTILPGQSVTLISDNTYFLYN